MCLDNNLLVDDKNTQNEISFKTNEQKQILKQSKLENS